MKLLVPCVIDERYWADETSIHSIDRAFIPNRGYEIFIPYIVHLQQTHVLALLDPTGPALINVWNIFWISEYWRLGAAWALVVAYGLVLFMGVLTGCNHNQLRWSTRRRTT